MFMPMEMFSDVFRPAQPEKRPPRDMRMRMDVIEKDDKYEISAELPGFTKDDISIGLKLGTLTISAEHSEEKNAEGDKFIRQERRLCSCKRSIIIGNEYTSEDVDAKFENGVLVINLPKKDKKAEKTEEKIVIK